MGYIAGETLGVTLACEEVGHISEEESRMTAVYIDKWHEQTGGLTDLETLNEIGADWYQKTVEFGKTTALSLRDDELEHVCAILQAHEATS